MAEIDWDGRMARHDPGRMRDTLKEFPAQCCRAIAIGDEFSGRLAEELDKIVVCGMGGSAMAGEIARRFARLPVFVNRSYSLPPFVDERTRGVQEKA